MINRELDTKKIVRIAVFLFFFFIIAGYSYFRSIDFIKGPLVFIESHESGETVNDNLLELTGSAKNISFITLNDGQIYTNEEGKFNEKLLLSPGYNIIKLSVRDRYAREKEEIIEIIYKSK